LERRILTSLDRVRVGWQFAIGGPGVSTFYFDSAASPPVAALKTFFGSLAPNIPDDIVFKYPSAGEQIEHTTGQLSGAWSGSVLADTPGTDNTGFAAPAGVMFKWLTGSILNGHRVVGRTFIVPIAGNCYATNGQITTAALTGFKACAANLLTAVAAGTSKPMVVYSSTHRQYRGVTGYDVSPKVALMTSRRE
jgi:hypothetical protein